MEKLKVKDQLQNIRKLIDDQIKHLKHSNAYNKFMIIKMPKFSLLKSA